MVTVRRDDVAAQNLRGQPTSWSTGSDAGGWLSCFASLTTLLLNQWTIQLGYAGLPMIGILVFLAPWVWIFARRPNFALASVFSNWPVLALPILALMSASWSSYP